MRLIKRFDHRLTAAAQSLPRSFHQPMTAVSFLGEPAFISVVALAGFLRAEAHHQAGTKHAFVYAYIAFIFSSCLKLILRRARPHNLDIRTLGVRSYSFPSGHAFGTVIFYGLISYLSLRYQAHPWDILIAFILWSLIGAIGLSRVYLKAHYPSDVAGGWLLGIIALAAVLNLAF